MTFSTGFFSRTEVRSRVSKNTDTGLSVERLQILGLSGIRRMNPDALTPEMKPAGNPNPDVYILGGAPDTADDDIGKPFSGGAGKMLRETLPGGYKYRYNYVCRTLPPFRNGSRRPLPHEIHGFANSVRADMETADPGVLVAVGATAMGWLLGETVARAGIDNCRGRKFPVMVGNRGVWVYPVMDPAEILKMEASRAYQSIPAAEYRRYLGLDLARVFADMENGIAKATVEPADMATGLRGVLIEKKSVNVIQNFLGEMREERAATIDLETDCFRPYADGAKILTMAIGTAARTIAFPWLHKDARWTKNELVRLREIVGNFLTAAVPKVAHNAPFEVEWLVKEFGTPVAWESTWHDTMGQAYLIDERPSSANKKKGGESGGSGISLNFCCLWHLGLNLKAIEQIDRANLANTNINLVLRYDGRDTKYTARIFDIQRKILKEIGQWAAYRQWVKRVPCLAMAQVIGVPVSQPVNAELRKRVGADIAAADAAIHKTGAVREFERLHGPYIDSNKNNLILFRDMLGYKKEIYRKGKWTVDEKALTGLRGEPAAAALLKRRGVATLLKTYLVRMDKNAPETFIFPDGKTHCSYKHTATDTRRIQAEGPSLLNQPREDSWVKKQYVAEPGCICLFNDYGAQEARCIAVMSRDPNMLRFMRENYDFHTVWAEKIVRKYDKTYRAFTRDISDPKKKMKAWRQRVKAQWVFAGFYYAKVGTRANYLEMPIRIAQELDDEFWDARDGFAGVRVWQKTLFKNYRELGYIESMGGHRRHGPMSESQIVNTGVQMSGTDITADAWYRICRYAFENDLPWLYPPLFVHDDLTNFSVPRKKRDDAVEIYARIMTEVRLPGAELLPWEIEIAEGPSWGEKKFVGMFSTVAVDKQISIFRKSGVDGLAAYNGGNGVRDLNRAAYK